MLLISLALFWVKIVCFFLNYTQKFKYKPVYLKVNFKLVILYIFMMLDFNFVRFFKMLKGYVNVQI